MSGTSDSRGYVGAAHADSAASEYGALSFIIEQMINQNATVALVQVKACTNAGGLAPVGTVDVQPMVHQIDGSGQATPHGLIYALPYARIQGGANAVILDPQAGDIGIALFASHDHSSVKATKAPATPGSRRRFDWADGLYVGGVLNGVPSQYVMFAAGGMTLVSPNQVTIQAPTITLAGNVASNGTFQNNGHDIGSTHLHSGVQSGGGNTGRPL